jgi:DNA (cytosine-5)-methyltransferase 1
MEKLKYFSMFSGIGGFEYGLQKVFPKAECVGFSEIDSDCEKCKREGRGKTQPKTVYGKTKVRCDTCGTTRVVPQLQIYHRHYPNHKNFGDATKIDPETIPDFDILVGGFPCQAFSICGDRRGMEDARGTLFFDIARILANKKPKYLLLENVKGLLSHAGGETITKIFGVLTDLGYVCQSEVLNSRYFGVPQNRERIFIFGSRTESRPQVFPLREDGEESNDRQSYVSSALDANYWKGSSRGYGGKHRQLIIHNVYGGFKEKKARVFEDCCPTLRTPQGGGHIPMVAMTERRTEKAKEIRRNTTEKDFCPRREKELVPRLDDISNAVTATQGREQFLSDGMKVRKLLPIECERLQGFPDGYTEHGIVDIWTDDRKCAMREVIAIIVNGNKQWVGSNWCEQPQAVCPRDKDNSDYSLCKAVCYQPNHAEVDALLKAGDGANGARLYLFGHEFCCTGCKATMRAYGIEEVIIGEFPLNRISDTQRYKALGNAVTTKVVQAIMAKFKQTEVNNED